MRADQFYELTTSAAKNEAPPSCAPALMTIAPQVMNSSASRAMAAADGLRPPVVDQALGNLMTFGNLMDRYAIAISAGEDRRGRSDGGGQPWLQLV